MELVAAGLIVLGLLWAGGFGYAHFRAAGKAKASLSWPQAQARILSSSVVVEESNDRDGNTSTWYNPVVQYSYSAGGGERQGSRLRFGNPRSGSRKKIEEMIARYPEGSTPMVRYNPEDPAECVLESTKPSPIYLIMAPFGLVFAFVGIVMLQGS
jgi:hypothetical protein